MVGYMYMITSVCIIWTENYLEIVLFQRTREPHFQIHEIVKFFPSSELVGGNILTCFYERKFCRLYLSIQDIIAGWTLSTQEKHAFFYNGCLWKFFFNFCQNFLSKARIKKSLIDDHYKTIFESVRSACSSYSVIELLPLSVGDQEKQCLLEYFTGTLTYE